MELVLETYRLAVRCRQAGIDLHTTFRGPTLHLVQSRLEQLLEAHHTTPVGMARRINRARTWLLRKLDPNSLAKRPLTLKDLEEILEGLSETMTVFCSPMAEWTVHIERLKSNAR